MIECADCSTGIPAHLAERWNGISLDQAHEDWKTIFRPTRRAADEGGQEG